MEPRLSIRWEATHARDRPLPSRVLEGRSDAARRSQAPVRRRRRSLPTETTRQTRLGCATGEHVRLDRRRIARIEAARGKGAGDAQKVRFNLYKPFSTLDERSSPTIGTPA